MSGREGEGKTFGDAAHAQARIQTKRDAIPTLRLRGDAVEADVAEENNRSPGKHPCGAAVQRSLPGDLDAEQGQRKEPKGHEGGEVAAGDEGEASQDDENDDEDLREVTREGMGT